MENCRVRDGEAGDKQSHEEAEAIKNVKRAEETKIYKSHFQTTASKDLIS